MSRNVLLFICKYLLLCNFIFFFVLTDGCHCNMDKCISSKIPFAANYFHRETKFAFIERKILFVFC